MNKARRDMLQQGIGLVGAATSMPLMEQRNPITDVQRALRQSLSGPSDKELKFLEQKMMLYWHARNNALLAPVDLILHMDEAEQTC